VDDEIVLVGPADVAVWRVTGADRASYLDAVLSQQVADLPAGTATSGLLLDAHGSPLLAVDLAVLDDHLLLLAPSALADEVERLLAGRTFLADARFTSDPRSALRVVGTGAAAAVETALGVSVPEGTAATAGDAAVVAIAAGTLVVSDDPDGLGSRLAAAGAETADADTVERWEVAHGVPRWGHEIVPGNLPEELGLLPTHVHLAKGCYPGQEAVARMWMLGRPRRRLAVVAPDAGVTAGWESGGGRRGARVTRIAPDADEPRALAFVPSDAAVGDRIEDDTGTGVRVVAIVGDGREVVGHDPAVTRRRDRR
jgi:folate-binding protein YgfZ